MQNMAPSLLGRKSRLLCCVLPTQIKSRGCWLSPGSALELHLCVMEPLGISAWLGSWGKGQRRLRRGLVSDFAVLWFWL